MRAHTIGPNGLWRVERPDKVDGRQTEHAKGTPSLGERWEWKRKKRRVHFITFIAHPPSLPIRPEWSPCGGRYTAPKPLRGEQGELENTCACLLEEPAFALVSVNLKTIEMNKGSNPVGVRRVCTLIQEAKCGSFVICWLMRLWTEGRPLDSCRRQYRRWCGFAGLVYFYDG